jgi:hypothetical protein
MAALQFSCTQRLLGVTTARALVNVNTTTAALTTVCTFATQPDPLLPPRVIAFIDDNTLVHFVGDASPVMERLSLSNPGRPRCNVVAVPRYGAAALAAFDGTPVLAAHRDVNSDDARVLVVAASPSKLFAVTADGTVTLVAALVRASDGAPVTPIALFVTGAGTTVCGIPPGAYMIVSLFFKPFASLERCLYYTVASLRCATEPDAPAPTDAQGSPSVSAPSEPTHFDGNGTSATTVGQTVTDDLDSDDDEPSVDTTVSSQASSRVGIDKHRVLISVVIAAAVVGAVLAVVVAARRRRCTLTIPQPVDVTAIVGADLERRRTVGSDYRGNRAAEVTGTVAQPVHDSGVLWRHSVGTTMDGLGSAGRSAGSRRTKSRRKSRSSATGSVAKKKQRGHTARKSQ